MDEEKKKEWFNIVINRLKPIENYKKKSIF